MVNKTKTKKVLKQFIPKRANIASIKGEALELPNLNKGKAPESERDLANKKYVDDADDVLLAKIFWKRTGTILSPITAGDDITTTGSGTFGDFLKLQTIGGGATIFACAPTGYAGGLAAERTGGAWARLHAGLNGSNFIFSNGHNFRISEGQVGDTPTKETGWSTIVYMECLSNVITLSKKPVIAGAGGTLGTLAYNGTHGGGGEGITYEDAGGVSRYALQFPGSDIVVVSNRASNGVVQIRANTVTGGAGGEVTAAIFEDDEIQLLPSGGNVGIGTATPTTKLSVDEKSGMTPIGGFAIKLTNKTGANSIKGYCVTNSNTTADAVRLVPIDEPNPIGVFLESGVADGSEAWIVVGGIGDVYFWGSTTLGDMARTGLIADTGEVAGQAMSEASPTSPFSVDKHFCEVGHVLEARTGAGLARVAIHFN